MSEMSRELRGRLMAANVSDAGIENLASKGLVTIDAILQIVDNTLVLTALGVSPEDQAALQSLKPVVAEVSIGFEVEADVPDLSPEDATGMSLLDLDADALTRPSFDA
ncbi:hypothetical protein HGA91_02795, partial [candidate division WWE3 bacterium]|nr:hypothetical protein [candidate division WWE3 bacterium]